MSLPKSLLGELSIMWKICSLGMINSSYPKDVVQVYIHHTPNKAVIHPHITTMKD